MTSPQTKQQTALRVKLENLSTRTTLMFCWHLGPAVSHLWAPSGKNRFSYYYNQKGNNTSADKEILGFRSKEGCMSWGILMDAKKTLYLDSNHECTSFMWIWAAVLFFPGILWDVLISSFSAAPNYSSPTMNISLIALSLSLQGFCKNDNAICESEVNLSSKANLLCTPLFLQGFYLLKKSKFENSSAKSVS